MPSPRRELPAAVLAMESSRNCESDNSDESSNESEIFDLNPCTNAVCVELAHLRERVRDAEYSLLYTRRRLEQVNEMN